MSIELAVSGSTDGSSLGGSTSEYEEVGEEEFNKWYNERKIIAPTHFVVVGSFLEKLVDKFEKI